MSGILPCELDDVELHASRLVLVGETRSMPRLCVLLATFLRCRGELDLDDVGESICPMTSAASDWPFGLFGDEAGESVFTMVTDSR